jgi:hypothetical protein
VGLLSKMLGDSNFPSRGRMQSLVGLLRSGAGCWDLSQNSRPWMECLQKCQTWLLFEVGFDGVMGTLANIIAFRSLEWHKKHHGENWILSLQRPGKREMLCLHLGSYNKMP